MKTFLVLMSCAVLSSCMHMGMMGAGAGHHSSAEHEMMSGPALEKEVVVGNVRATVLFPILGPGKGAVVRLLLRDVETGRPLGGASASLHATYVHEPEAAHDDPAGGVPADSISHRGRAKETGHDIDFNQEVRETAESGVYKVSYRSWQPGEHTLMVHVTHVPGYSLHREIAVQASLRMGTHRKTHEGGMMGSTSSETYVIVGAAIMGALMIGMLLARGHMF